MADNNTKKYDNEFITKEFFSLNQFGENKTENKRFSACIANRFSIWLAIKGADENGKFKKNECTFFSRIEELANINQMLDYAIMECQEGNSFDVSIISKDKEFGIIGRKLVKGDMNIGFYLKNKEAGQNGIVYAPISDAFYVNSETDKSPLPASKGLAILMDFKLKVMAIIDRSSQTYASHLREVSDSESNKYTKDRGYKDDNNSAPSKSNDGDEFPF